MTDPVANANLSTESAPLVEKKKTKKKDAVAQEPMDAKKDSKKKTKKKDAVAQEPMDAKQDSKQSFEETRHPNPATKFGFDDDIIAGIKAHLDVHGFVVIPGVLTEEEVEMCKTMFHLWRTTIFGEDMNATVQATSHGIFKHYEVGHQPLAWFIRCNPKVQALFAAIWNTTQDNLVPSFDGCSFVPESNTLRDSKEWTHVDQGFTKPNHMCWQGFVALTTNKERTLVVYDGSHNDLHQAYYAEFNDTLATTAKGDTKKNKKGEDVLMHPKPQEDWQMIAPEFLERPEVVDRKRIVEVFAGSLVLWDSRLFHKNHYGPVLKEGEMPKEGDRLVQYVSFMPKDSPANNAAMQEKRRKYFNERRTTSHWAYPIRVNSLQPNSYGKDNDSKINYDALPKPDLSSFHEAIAQLLDLN